MLVSELVKKYNNDFMHKYYACKFDNEFKDSVGKKKHSVFDVYESYQGLFNDLINVVPKGQKEQNYIKLRRGYDRDNATEFGYFFLDVVMVEDGNEYSIMASDWDEILGCEIEEESIRAYGAEDCLFWILYEMTWFGWDNKVHSENLKGFLHELDEAGKCSIDECKSLDELFDDDDCPLSRPTEEDLEEVEIEFKKVAEFNKRYLDTFVDVKN